jgi:hypothetical protein
VHQEERRRQEAGERAAVSPAGEIEKYRAGKGQRHRIQAHDAERDAANFHNGGPGVEKGGKLRRQEVTVWHLSGLRHAPDLVEILPFVVKYLPAAQVVKICHEQKQQD